MKTSDILSALKPVVNVLDQFSIPYYIGGSIASSIYGFARATMDIDLVADIKDEHIPVLKEHLQKTYYIDEDMIKEAIIKKSSFNLIHLETTVKIDIFIQKNEPFHKETIQRKILDTLDEDDLKAKFYFSSPEDIIINKLLWYDLGERISERQWTDIIGVIKVQGDSLDKDYLKNWSSKLGLIELLNKAFTEAGISPKT